MKRLRLWLPLLATLLYTQLAWGQILSTGTGHPISVNGATFSVTSGVSPPSAGPAYDPYPRIFAYAQGGTMTAYASANWTTYAPMYNALVYGGYVGAESTIGGANTFASVMLAAQTASPLSTPPRQGHYIMGTEQSTVGGGGNQSTFAAWSTLVNNGAGTGGWWVRASWPSGAISTNDANSGLLLLNPNNTGTDSNSRTIFQEFAYHFDNYWSLGNAVGESTGAVANAYNTLYFLDNEGPRPNKAGAWGAPSDTTDYAANNATANAYFQKGSALQVAAVRAQHSGIVIAGNTNYWLLYVQGALSGGLVSQRDGLFDYAFAEGVEEWMADYTAAQLFAGLEAEETEVSTIGTVVVGNYFSGDGGNGVNWTSGAQSTWTTANGQWQAARAWNAMTQMRNWAWAPGTNGNVLYWFDEDEQGGSPGWLSKGTQRLDPPQTAANGPVALTGTGNVSKVWVRRFPNGWVLWNPYGNGSVTITNIPTTLHRLTNISSSTGDPTINTGAAVGSSVTLGDTCGTSSEACGDGLFLIGTG